MARAAGISAYIAAITSRDRNIFLPGYPQASASSTIGSPSSTWMARKSSSDLRFALLRSFPYQTSGTEAHLGRRCSPDRWHEVLPLSIHRPSSIRHPTSSVSPTLTMDQQGESSPVPVKMTFIGSPALGWRQSALTSDSTSLERELQDSVERILPQGMDVKVATIEKLEDYESPLTVTFNVKGPIGSSTGKRLLFAGDIFETNSKPTFPHEKREVGVYFHILTPIRMPFASTSRPALQSNPCPLWHDAAVCRTPLSTLRRSNRPTPPASRFTAPTP